MNSAERGPRKVYLELTDACNLDCTICFRRMWNQAPLEIPRRLADLCLSQIRDLGIAEVVLGGIGEPTIAGCFLPVVDQLGGCRVTLTTNGTSADPEILRAVSRLDRVVVSLDGLGPVFEGIRGIPASRVLDFLKAVDGTRRKAGTGKPELVVQMVVSRANVDQTTGVLDAAAEVHADQVVISQYVPCDQESADQILYSRYKDDSLKNLFSAIGSYGRRKGLKVRLPAYELKTERVCRFAEADALVITAAGSVAPCYRLSHSGTEVVFGRGKSISPYSFGQASEMTLREIWDSPDYQRFRAMVRGNQYVSCPDCDWVEGCDSARSTQSDCTGEAPSCADCLWARNLVYCV